MYMHNSDLEKTKKTSVLLKTINITYNVDNSN